MTETLIHVALVYNDAKKEMVDFHRHFVAAMQETTFDPSFQLIASRDLNRQAMTRFTIFKDEQSMKHETKWDFVIVFHKSKSAAQVPRVEFGSKAQSHTQSCPSVLSVEKRQVCH